MANPSRPSHPATVWPREAIQPRLAPERPPHPATVWPRGAIQPRLAPELPPHPATVWPRDPSTGTARAPHLAAVLQRSAAGKSASAVGGAADDKSAAATGKSSARKPFNNVVGEIGKVVSQSLIAKVKTSTATHVNHLVDVQKVNAKMTIDGVKHEGATTDNKHGEMVVIDKLWTAFKAVGGGDRVTKATALVMACAGKKMTVAGPSCALCTAALGVLGVKHDEKNAAFYEPWAMPDWLLENPELMQEMLGDFAGTGWQASDIDRARWTDIKSQLRQLGWKKTPSGG